jgi:hypothetical protein
MPRKSHREDQREIIDKLLADIDVQRRERPFDLVAFSGDLAFSGTAEEYELATELLLDPVAALTQVPRSRIFLIPGNHDVDRRLIDVDAEVGFAALNSSDMVNDLLDSDVRRGRATERPSDSRVGQHSKLPITRVWTENCPPPLAGGLNSTFAVLRSASFA